MKKKLNPDEIIVLPLDEIKLKLIPDFVWKRFIKDKYEVECLDIDTNWFGIGEEADNGFLELDCFCETLNQTSIDISEKDYLSLKEYFTKERLIRPRKKEYTILDMEWAFSQGVHEGKSREYYKNNENQFSQSDLQYYLNNYFRKK